MISGLAAVALFERGAEAIDFSTLGLTAMAWVASPLCGAGVAAGIQVLLDRRIFSAADPVAAAFGLRPILVAGTVGLVVVFLCSKGPAAFRLGWVAAAAVAAAAAAAAGIAARLFQRPPAYSALPVSTEGLPEGSSPAERERWLLVGQTVGKGAADHAVGGAGNSVISGPLGCLRRREATMDEGPGGDGSAGTEAELVERQFTGLLVLTGCTVAFAHGGNDMANATGPLTLALETARQSDGLDQLQRNLPALAGLMFVLGRS